MKSLYSDLKLFRGLDRGKKAKNQCVFWVYDERSQVDEVAEARERIRGTILENVFKNSPAAEADFRKSSEEYGKIIWGKSYGHKKICEITVHRGGLIHYQFDGDLLYCEAKIRTIMRKAKRAAKRIKWEDSSS